MIGLSLLTLALTLAAPAPPQTLDEVRAISDPLRRFDAAISFAELRFKAAQNLVRDSGSRQELKATLSDVAGAYELALDSLRATGRPLPKLGRQCKKGEVSAGTTEHRMHELRLAVAFDDRAMVEEAHARVTTAHDEFLHGVMSK